MIKVINFEKPAKRSFGWVQDPGDLIKLIAVVSVFDNKSSFHNLLKTKLIPEKISTEDGRDRFINELNKSPLILKYSDLVGTSFTPRSSARCNGIIQAAIKGQKRDFIADWPADNFIRWAHCLGFISYDYKSDSFSITDDGLRLSMAKHADDNDTMTQEEIDIITEAMLSYPPAVRILTLLEHGDILTKFEIGAQLGFIGENGFTSLSQDLLIKALELEQNSAMKKQLVANWEGSADKYARMIGGWLVKLGLLSYVPKVKRSQKVMIPGYQITTEGIIQLKHTKGTSKFKLYPKNISFERFSTKSRDRDFLRLRRSYIVDYLHSKRHKEIKFDSIIAYLKTKNIRIDAPELIDDLYGLVNIGLSLEIKQSKESCIFTDNLKDFTIVLHENIDTPSHILKLKNIVRAHLDVLPHSYLNLIDLAYDKTQSRQFEICVLDFLVNECNFTGIHLGGASKPDAVVYTTDLEENYCLIIDTKAYKDPYNLPISQEDEMVRYLTEFKNKDSVVNPNTWWNVIQDDISRTYFMFVSGEFSKSIATKLNKASLRSGYKGVALNVANLLILGNEIKKKNLNLEWIADNFFENKEYVLIDYNGNILDSVKL